MNLYTISTNPKECFQALDDIILRKTLLESGQMISTAIRVFKRDGIIEEEIPEDVLYKMYNMGEEHNVWVRETQGNYRWTFYYLMAGLDEYQYRFDKRHDAWKIAGIANHYEKYFPEGRMTPFPRKFNKSYDNYDDLMKIEDTCLAYKKYLITKWNNDTQCEDGRKKPIWTKREKPEFYTKSLSNT